jgi:hypothetical protein
MCEARIDLVTVAGLKALGYHKSAYFLENDIEMVATMILRKICGKTMILKKAIMAILIHSQYSRLRNIIKDIRSPARLP